MNVVKKMKINLIRILVLLISVLVLNMGGSNKPFAAKICPECMNTTIHLESALTNDTTHQYKCDNCNYTYKENHTTTKWTEDTKKNKKTGTCTICNSIFSVEMDDKENAEQKNNVTLLGTGQTGGLPNLNEFAPTISSGGGATVRIGKILGILRIIGAAMTVVAIALIGFNAMLGSVSEKAEYQQKIVGVLFAGIFMVASTSIAKMIISVATSI